MRKIQTGAVEFPPLPYAQARLLEHILVAFAVELGNSLATDLDVELHGESPWRCSARMSSTVRTCPGFTSFKS